MLNASVNSGADDGRDGSAGNGAHGSAYGSPHGGAAGGANGSAADGAAGSAGGGDGGVRSVEFLVQRLTHLLLSGSSAAAYEALGKQGDVAPHIRALVPDLICVGPAFTVRTVPGYGDDITEAVDTAPAGSVLVIDIGETHAACTWGGTGTTIAQRRGIAGMVSTGHVRDIAEIRRARFPVFAQGTVVSGWRRGQRGALQVPVSLGGQVVMPGDLVCADDDGVVVLPAAQFAAAEVALARRLRFEAEAHDIVAAGGSYADIIARKPG